MLDKTQLGLSLLLLLICSGGIFISIQKTTAKPAVDTVKQELPSPIASPVVYETVDVGKLYNLINGFRKESDLPELRIHPALEKSSRLKLQNMIDEEYWRHEDSENVQSWYLFNQAGYDYIKAGENLAFGLNTAWDVFDGWLESPRHKQELLTSEYQDMGLAVDCATYKQEGKPSCVVVLHLGTD